MESIVNCSLGNVLG